MPSVPHPMRFSSRLVDKRIIAFVMLFVWVLTLGAGLANACLVDGLKSEPVDHHSGWTSTAIVPSAFAADADNGHTRTQDGDDAARIHMVHCQPMQAAELATPSRLTAERSSDLDSIVATITYGNRPARSTEGRFSARQHLAPIFAELPLFIRFRRLMP